MHIYISGALNGSANLPIARAKYERVASQLRKLGLAPYLPHTKTDPIANSELSPEQVYLADAEAIKSAAAAVVFLDEPSLGVGLEIARFVELRTPFLALHDKAVEPSRFARGFLAHSGIDIVTYDSDPGPEVSNWAAGLMTVFAA